jgi:rod shape-determining protein MreC
MSTIFPAGIPIGTVLNYSRKPLTNFYEIEVAMFQDMTNLGVIYVIENPDRLEINSFQNLSNEQ